jgi:rare lipoprotein A
MHRATMKSYVIAGTRYYPTTARVGERLNGIASWYGPNFHSKLTSNGEIYNMYAMTAAHKTLPMNTIVKVYNKENGKSVIVRINDRGPFVTGRIIDLSNVAAHKIDMVKKGTARVKVTILGFNAKITKTNSKFYVQVGAFKSLNGARNLKRKFNLILDNRYKVIIKKTDLNLVWISGFKSEAEAENFKINNNLKLAIIIAQ